MSTQAPTTFTSNVLITERLVSTTGVQATPTNAYCGIELKSTASALLLSRLTTAQRDAMTAVNGMICYNSTTDAFNLYEGGAWVAIGGGGGGPVTGPVASTDNAIARWDGITGALLQNSTVIVGDTGAITAVLSIANDAGTAAAPSYTFTGDVDTGIYHSGANTVDIATNGLRQVSVGTVAATVNYLQFIGSATNTPVLINALGTDGNIGIELVPLGTGAVINPVGAVATPGITFHGDVDTGMWNQAANTIGFSTNGALAATIDANANFGVRTNVFGTNATNTLGISSGTAPTTGPADTIQLYSIDVTAGNTTLGLFTEGTPISATTITAADHSLAVYVNGTIYYIPCKLTND
jgi:hypothetical protein